MTKFCQIFSSYITQLSYLNTDTLVWHVFMLNITKHFHFLCEKICYVFRKKTTMVLLGSAKSVNYMAVQLNCHRNMISRRFQLQETSDRSRSRRPKVTTTRQDAYYAYVNALNKMTSYSIILRKDVLKGICDSSTRQCFLKVYSFFSFQQKYLPRHKSQIS